MNEPAVYTRTKFTSPPNVVIFGETGAGKSSVINMIAGEKIAITSSSLSGCTFDSTKYMVAINGIQFRLWDTAGLNETEHGTVATKDAIIRLYRLINELSLNGGVNLLVYCVRAPRITRST